MNNDDFVGILCFGVLVIANALTLLQISISQSQSQGDNPIEFTNVAMHLPHDQMDAA
jgi:hypothetical protein